MPKLALAPQSKLHSFPLSLADATVLVKKYHRTHGKVATHRFSLAALDDSGRVCGVAIVGKPAARHTDYTTVAEISRLVSDGTPNVCSFLMAQCADICNIMGFRRIQTFAAVGPNSSLKALKSSGWKFETTSFVGDKWTASRPKVSLVSSIDQLASIKILPEMKTLWAKELNSDSPLPTTESIMPKITDEPLRVIQVRIFEKDYQRLQQMYGNDPSFSMNKAVRTMIHTMLNQLEDKINQAIDASETERVKEPQL